MGDFFLTCEDFGRMFNNSFPACVFWGFFFKVEISLHTLIPLFGQDQSTVSWDDCNRVFPAELCVSSFLIGSHAMHAQRHSQPTPTSLVRSRAYACLSVICHLHFCQNDWGLLCATAVTGGQNGHWIRVSTQNWLWRRKFSTRSCWDSNLQSFDHESGALDAFFQTMMIRLSCTGMMKE